MLDAIHEISVSCKDLFVQEGLDRSHLLSRFGVTFFCGFMDCKLNVRRIRNRYTKTALFSSYRNLSM